MDRLVKAAFQLGQVYGDLRIPKDTREDVLRQFHELSKIPDQFSLGTEWGLFIASTQGSLISGTFNQGNHDRIIEYLKNLNWTIDEDTPFENCCFLLKAHK